MKVLKVLLMIEEYCRRKRIAPANKLIIEVTDAYNKLRDKYLETLDELNKYTK